MYRLFIGCNCSNVIKERSKGVPKAQAVGTKGITSLQVDAALKGFPEH